MKELITILDRISGEVLVGDIGKYKEDITLFLANFLQFMPKLISYYSKPQMSDLAGDATYWPAQYERIVDAVNRYDDFYLVDVLYNETYANLQELYGILKDRQVQGI